jgi:hypothetical protein
MVVRHNTKLVQKHWSQNESDSEMVESVTNSQHDIRVSTKFPFSTAPRQYQLRPPPVEGGCLPHPRKTNDHVSAERSLVFYAGRPDAEMTRDESGGAQPIAALGWDKDERRSCDSRRETHPAHLTRVKHLRIEQLAGQKAIHEGLPKRTKNNNSVNGTPR